MNLERAAILLIDGGVGLDLVTQIFYGFGARTLHRCRTLAEARTIIHHHTLDLIVMEANHSDGDGYGLIQVLRSGELSEDNRFCPVIVLSAHTASNQVAHSRDCGANFFVAKPISPQVLMDRLLWIAREKRQYLECDNYIGPDRRFQTEPQPEDGPRRRRTDRAPALISEEGPTE